MSLQFIWQRAFLCIRYEGLAEKFDKNPLIYRIEETTIANTDIWYILADCIHLTNPVIIGWLLASPPATPPLLIVVYAYKLGHTKGRGATSRTRIESVHEEEGCFHLEEIPGSHPVIHSHNITYS